MSLELKPYAESVLRQEADREGISVDDLIVRTFTSKQAPLPTEADSEKERVLALLRQWQQEYGLPVPRGGYKPLSQLFAEWNAEDAQMTDEEREEERRFWEDYERGRDDRPLQI